MKSLSYNAENLNDDEVNEIVRRVKIFLINDNKEILFANSNGGIQLIGGHIENGESDKEAILREVQEESGITLEKDKISLPFYEVKYYKKNYNNTISNRLSVVSYYFCKTSERPNIEKLRLTENEKKNEFELIYIPYDNIEKTVKSYLNNEKKINTSIAKEILGAFEELKKYLWIEKNKWQREMLQW